jgi:hypothetical protein
MSTHPKKRRTRMSRYSPGGRQTLFDLADQLTEAPSGDPIQMWVLGLVSPLICLTYGIVCIVTRHGRIVHLSFRGTSFYGHQPFPEIEGAPAVSLGFFLISVASFMHFQWFWGSFRPLVAYHEIGKYLSVGGIVAASACYIYWMLR